jgi:hypothetical protein
MRKGLLAVVSSLGLSLPASAAPILNVSTSAIADSPTQTVITFSVNPNGTPLAGLVLNFWALASGLEIVDIASSEPGIILESGPALAGSDWVAGFAGNFFPDRSAPFTLGTLTLEGFVPGTPLVASGNFTDSGFNDILIGPSNVAIVTPEPQSAALLAFGIALLAFGRRSRPAA